MVVGAVVDVLLRVLVGLRSQDLSDVHVDVLAAEVVELRRLVDGLEVEWTRRLAHLEQSDVIALEGHSSMTAFLKGRCRMSGARAQRSVTLSHRLASLPFVSKAFESDDLSFDQVQVFAHVPDHLADELAAAEVMRGSDGRSRRCGTRSIFVAAGFTEVSKPTLRRVVMRIDF